MLTRWDGPATSLVLESTELANIIEMQTGWTSV